MASLLYVGKPATVDETVVTRSSTDDQLDAGPSRSYTDGQILTQADQYATKTHVDVADSQYADVAYYQSRDALNVPLTQVGQPGGVASLVGGKIPSAQIPPLGSGVLRGPWGVSETSGGTTSHTPLRIATFNIGQTAWNFRPLVFLNVQVEVSHLARPVIEVRIGTPADTTYASQTLVARGFGYAALNDTQTVTVFPGAEQGAMSDGGQTFYGPNYDTRLHVWVFSSDPGPGQLTVGAGALWAASAYVVRVTE